MSSRSDSPPITVGTAGHIDHGKTLLVERLTGMRADRPHEQERGMTIDIGYAEMRSSDGRRIGFVDLPGHERFIRNMVAGATGIDLALLVVAADDGVMPQTREHVEILGLLGIRRVLVVLNKVDAVDPEMCELAREELVEFLGGTALRGAPVFPCSALTGAGIPELTAAIEREADGIARVEDPGCFFLAIQRSFAAAGFGCVVTGVPAAGSVAVGDELELLPARRTVRVRAIEVYHESATRARAGHRTALNLAGVPHDETGRGMVVAEPGIFSPTRHVAARLAVAPTAPRALRHAAGVRLLTGTLEEMASVYLLAGSSLRPGEGAIVELRTREPIAVRDGAPFILRSDNAQETLGGGKILAALEGPVGRRNTVLQEELRRWDGALADTEGRIRAALLSLGDATAPAVGRKAQVALAATEEVLQRLVAAGTLVLMPTGAYANAAALAEAASALRRTLTGMHEEQPLLAALPIAEVRDRAGLSEARLASAVERLGAAVVMEARTIRLAGHRVQVDEGLTRAARQLLDCLTAARFAPPPVDKLPEAAALAARETTAALTLLRDRGAVREVAPGVLYRKETLEEGLRILQRVASHRGNFEPVDAKAALGDISRKWLIPLLEYYDRLGATRRNGNARTVTRRGEAILAGGLDAK